MWPRKDDEALRYGPLGGQHYTTALDCVAQGVSGPTGTPYDFKSGKPESVKNLENASKYGHRCAPTPG